MVAACEVISARTIAPGRVPTALDCRFLRALPAGTARVVPRLVHSGRSMSCVSIDVEDERGRLATRATVSLVDRAAVRPLDHPDARPLAHPGSVEIPSVPRYCHGPPRPK